MEFNKEDIQTKLLTASGLITDRPAWVFSTVAEDYESTSSVIVLYSGRGTNGEIKFYLAPTKYNSDVMVFNSPVFFKDGIYADFAANGHSIFVQYLPVY